MEEKNTNLLRDFLLIVLSVIIAMTCFVVANNYGLFAKNQNAATSTDGGSELTVAQVAEKAIVSSVSVYVTDKTKHYYESAGSGVILKYNSTSGEAFVITNDHVIAESVEGGVNVYYLDRYYQATLVGTDPHNDIAVLSFTPGFAPVVAQISRSMMDLKVGERVVAVGNAAALDYTVTDGLISFVGRKEDYSGIEKNYVQTSAVVNAGNSGGGLFDMQGNLIAINTMGLSNYDDLNFSLPILFDSTVSVTNTNYDESHRDAITSFNCLIKKHNELVASEAENKVGYIEGQRYIGAKFETLTKADGGTITQYAYVSGIYDYFELEAGSYNWTGLRYASAIDYTNILLDTISKVEYSTDGGETWQQAVLEGETLFTSVALSGSFTAVQLMDFVRKAPINTLLRFTVQTKAYNQVTGALSNSGFSKTTIAKVSQYMFSFATSD